VERSVRLLDQYPQASFVHTALLMVDTLNMPLSLDIRSLPELLAGDRMRKLLAQSWASPVMAATAMVRRDAYQRVGLYRDHRYGLGCDLDMWFRLAGCGDVAYINEPQAFIRVRQRGDKTALFRWTNTVGLISMQHDFIEEVFRDRFGDYYLQRFRHFFQRDRLLFNVMLRALLLEPAHVVAEGQPIVHKQASIFTRMVLGLVGRSYALQQMLKTFVAPIHYSRITNNMNANKSQVYHYVATNQEIHDMLDSLQTQSIG
jgi:hypothetical protein